MVPIDWDVKVEPQWFRKDGRCRADHLNPVATDGSTAPTNGAPLCKHHNQTKNRRFTTRRDLSGHWHTYRPDGQNS